MVKVLVVDDNDILRSMLTMYLKDPNVSDIVEAGTAEEAVAIATEENPDVIVCDSRMPGVAGDEAGRRIRDLLPDTRIVSYSGITVDKPWADEVIVKGSPDDLMRLKRAVLGTTEA
ncbi:MAG: response regulator [Actinomycetota bacterium]|nr:response regulator [Actinomycetota bacterium]